MSDSSIYNWLYFKKNSILLKWRALSKYYFFKRMDVKLGQNVFIRRGNGSHKFGKGLIIYDNTIFEVYSKDAVIKTGDNCFLSYGIVIACTLQIELGNNVWIGEYTSLRDSSHSFSVYHPLGTGKDIHEAIRIGNNVWIGRGCLILPGTIIEDNVVIAANSVVKGICNSGSLYGGSPGRFIKSLS